MRKKYILITFSTAALLSLSFADFNSPQIETMRIYNAHKLYDQGPEAGYAGAPGDANCTQCHGGTVQDGAPNALIISNDLGPVTGYTPGQTYDVTVSFTGAGPKNGFQTVPLAVSNNAMAGTVAAGTGTQIKNGSSGRKYMTHTLSGSSQTSWTFTWTAPATDMGGVRFYLATNQTNNNNSSNGDIIRLSQHDVSSFAAVEELSKNKFEAGFSPETNILHVNLSANTSGAGFLNIVDLSGNSVFTEQLGKISSGESDLDVRLPETIKSGIYIVNVAVDNNFASKKIAIFK